MALPVYTPRTFITAALQTIGVVGPGETPATDIMTPAFARFQDLIDAYGADRLQIYGRTRVTKTVTAAQSSYTIGAAGDIAIVWPTYIDTAAYVQASSSPAQELPMRGLTDAEWAAQSIKTLASTIATTWYYDHAFASGLGKFYVHPVPDVSGDTLVLYVPTALVVPVTLDSVMSQPPGAPRLFRLALADELSDEFGVVGPVADRVRGRAKEAQASWQIANDRPQSLQGDPMFCGPDTRGTLSILTNSPKSR